MIHCTNCNQPGHNKNNNKCIFNIIYGNIEKLDSFTHSYHYYSKSLDYLLHRYPKRFCVMGMQILWSEGELKNTEYLYDYIETKKCKLNFLIVKLSIEGIHANYLLFDFKAKIIYRYEPHGIARVNRALDNNLTLLGLLTGMVYIPAEVSCPYIGIQSVSFDNRGMCQTAVLYDILRFLDPKKTKHKRGMLNIKLAREELKRVASLFLTDIYYKLPENLRVYFLDYNNITSHYKQTILSSLRVSVNFLI